MSPSWFDSFEDKVHKSIRQMDRLRKENARLKAQIRKLEQSTSGKKSTESESAAEREALREQVAALVKRLERLVE